MPFLVEKGQSREQAQSAWGLCHVATRGGDRSPALQNLSEDFTFLLRLSLWCLFLFSAHTCLQWEELRQGKRAEFKPTMQETPPQIGSQVIESMRGHYRAGGDPPLIRKT